MYSSRRFHNKADTGFLHVGTPYEVEKPRESRHKGKQFLTNPPKLGQTQGYFGSFEYTPASYEDSIGYRHVQPSSERKKAFGTGDAHRRDEFTQRHRAEAWRQTLEKEQRLLQRRTLTAGLGERALALTGSDVVSGSPRAADTPAADQGPARLYDVGRTRVTPPCHKCSRDRFYCKHRLPAAVEAGHSPRRLGGLRTTTMIYGREAAAAAPEKPAFGARSHTKEFYDAGSFSFSPLAV